MEAMVVIEPTTRTGPTSLTGPTSNTNPMVMAMDAMEDALEAMDMATTRAVAVEEVKVIASLNPIRI